MVGFNAPPFAPQKSLGRAEGEQTKRLLADGRRFVQRGRRIRCDVRGRERGKANGIRPATALTIELRQNGVDA